MSTVQEGAVLERVESIDESIRHLMMHFFFRLPFSACTFVRTICTILQIEHCNVTNSIKKCCVRTSKPKKDKRQKPKEQTK
jgi:hypothetical protein